MMQTPPPARGEWTRSSNSKYGPSYGTPSPSYVDRRRNVNVESTPLSPVSSSRPPVWSNVDMRPRYSEMPRSRKRIRKGDSFAKWTTRMVLASPLLVLVLWSMALVLHAGKTVPVVATQQQQQQPKQGSARVSSRPKKNPPKIVPRPLPHNMRATQSTQSVVVQPQALGKRASETTGKHHSRFIPVVTPKAGSSGHGIPIIAPLGQSESTEPLGSTKGGERIPIIAPLGDQQPSNAKGGNPGNDVNVVSRPRPKPRSTQFNSNESMMSTQNGNALAATQSAAQQMMAVQNSENQLMAVQNSENQLMAVQDNAMKSTETGGTALMATQETGNAMMGTAQASADQLTSTQASANLLTSTRNGGPKIYFYDSAKSIRNGQLHVPEIVYDVAGTPIELATLNDGRTEIYLEPPKLGATQQETPALELGENISKQFQENMPQAQDQMIIICTVATMALLVGALSARRLRSRQFLSSCIENESLEDELAYDTAYTTSAGSTASYDTFGAAHWKGDLEKFDV